MKAYTPEQASGSTSSAVRTPQVASVKNSALMGSTPLNSYHGQQVTGPHVTAAHAFNTPSQPAILTGGVGHHQNQEVRNPSNGVPHLPMKPGM